MPVYVDNMRARYGTLILCHMTADSLDELHQMAARLGLSRAWFQNKRIPHYDISLSKRARAVALGAIEETTRQTILRIRAASAAGATSASERSPSTQQHGTHTPSREGLT